MITFRILPVIENRVLGPYTLLRIKDRNMHKEAKCGQFVMVGFPSSLDPFLLRPLSFLSIAEDSFSLLIKKKGRGTEKLSELSVGDELKILGPLGRYIIPPKSGILIAGGIGIAPLYYQSLWMSHGILFYGAKRKRDILFSKDFESRGFTVKTITEEERGTVADLVRENLEILEGQQIFICGPDAMTKALKDIIGGYAKQAFVYMERRMGCGLGGCKSCAVKTDSGYKLVCQDGPVFPLKEVSYD